MRISIAGTKLALAAQRRHSFSPARERWESKLELTESASVGRHLVS